MEPKDLEINAALSIPSAELEWRAVRSGGPGGQNVNKVATKVLLLFDPDSSSLSPSVRERLRRLAANRLAADGRIAVSCETTRSQAKNLSLARELLAELIRSALVVPKRRKKTRPSAAVKRARVDQKRKTAAKKQTRAKPNWD